MDRYLEMESHADANAPLGLAADVVAQVEAAVQFILAEGAYQQVSLVTHSWGIDARGVVRRQAPEPSSTESSCSPRSAVARAALHATPDTAGVEATHE